MIVNLYLFYVLIKDKSKLKKAVYLSLIIYVISIYFSILTNTSSSTYLEGIGYKGYFESGNSFIFFRTTDTRITGKFYNNNI